ncbi:MAG TPA: carbamoyl-phosphate synthase large subunit [Rhodospirillaceae bacterium]|jgi:carbamoyl-phosphate synthase large subunit|nr:carbamoyl-phosphate synthase large subunit [Alphaproteobacteria bacterium]HBH26600.1 carbamoyl-phosphate synthase large subunit [Rhodospirillaceae bacterium]
MLQSDECAPSDREKVIILGGGPNRIGQGIEFDYCCVHACYALRAAGFETIMVNCNPETVSTDYDTADRLYFEPLTAEDVLEIVHAESHNGNLRGVIVQLGGQTPLGLARALEAEGVPILGTSPDAIDLAEDRERFQRLLNDLGLKQPPNGIARSAEEAETIAGGIGFPLVIRPSYVLGGRGMEIVHDMSGLKAYIGSAVRVSEGTPVLLDRYLKSAIEVDVDAVADGETVYVAGVMEHIEEAGIHSGDSACVLPPHSLTANIVDTLRAQTIALARALNVRGLMNVQFAVRKGEVYILEVNPRASRTVPFVAKATGVPVAKIAAQVMAGAPLSGLLAHTLAPTEANGSTHYAVKAPVFPFNRFPGVEPLLGPEMRSTGEVMGWDADLARAMAKAQIGAGQALPTGGTVFLSVRDEDKAALTPIARDLAAMGFALIATGGTARHLAGQGLSVARVNKVAEGQPHIVDAMINGDVALVINTTAKTAAAVADAHSLRRVALMHKIPYYTLLTAASAGVRAIGALRAGGITATPLQKVHAG